MKFSKKAVLSQERPMHRSKGKIALLKSLSVAIVAATISTGLPPSPVQASVTTVNCGTSGTFTIDTNVVTGHTLCVGSVVIPEGVTSIATMAFFPSSGPTSVAIPASVTLIGLRALGNMNALTSITVDAASANFSSDGGVLFNKTKSVLVQNPGGLPATTYSVPASVTTIGDGAFEGTSLNSITIPPNVTNIGEFTFGGSQIASVVFSGTSTLATIGGYVFNNMPNLASLTIPPSVTSIGTGAFLASGLTSITIPSSVTSIGEFAFNGTNSLQSVVFSGTSTLATIDLGAFQSSGITSITIPPNVTTIGEQAFQYSGLASVTFSGTSTLATIGSAAFQATQLTSITIPSSVTSIGFAAFNSAMSLASVVFSGTSTLATIGAYAFSGTSLTSITLPASVTTIGDRAFSGNRSLATMTVEATNPNYSSLDNVLFDKQKTSLINYSLSKTATTYSIPSSVTSIEAEAFNGASFLTAITVPAGVLTIGARAFVGMGLMASFTVAEANPNFSSLNGVLFDKQKTSLINYPLSKTETSYSIPSSVTSIQAFAFNEGSSLTSVIIPAGVITIENYAFWNASRLNVYFLGNAPATVSNDAFENVGGKAYIKTGATDFAPVGDTWKRLTVAVLDDGTRPCTSGGTYTIQDFVVTNGFSCAGAAVIPDGVQAIGESAFTSNESLITVTIPATATFIHPNSFSLSPALTSFSVDSANPNFSSAEGVLFNKEKSSLLLFPPGKGASYVVPASVVTIADRAFINGSLTAITIPGNVESIGSHAFFGAEGLTSVTFSGTSTLASIGENAFKQSKLETINIPASVTIIGDAAFALTPLRSVTFAENSSITTISSSMFESVQSLTSITIPASVTSIESYAFYGASQLANVVFLGNAPTPVGVEAFTEVAAGAKATISASATGFPAVGSAWNGLIVETASSPSVIPPTETPPAAVTPPAATPTAAVPVATPPAATPPAAVPVATPPAATPAPVVDLVAQAAAADLASRTVKAKARFVSKSLAKRVGVKMVSSKAKVTFTVASSSRKICVKSGTSLRTLKKGKCRVTFTVQEPKPKKGKALKPRRTTKTLVVQ